MTLEQQYSRLTKWQLGLFAGPILLQILRIPFPAPFGESGQLAYVLVRFSITVICLVAVGILEFKKYKLRTGAAQVQRGPENP